MKKMLKKIWIVVIRTNFFIISKLPMVIILFIGLFYTIYLGLNISEDTTKITNTAFGIVLSFSALSFSCSRAIKDSDKDKELFQFAGEKFLHSGIMLITVSIMKYATLEMSNEEIFIWAIPILEYIVPVLFFFSLITAHGGILINNKLLWKRFNRFKDWDDFF